MEDVPFYFWNYSSSVSESLLTSSSVSGAKKSFSQILRILENLKVSSASLIPSCGLGSGQKISILYQKDGIRHLLEVVKTSLLLFLSPCVIRLSSFCLSSILFYFVF